MTHFLSFASMFELHMYKKVCVSCAYIYAGNKLNPQIILAFQVMLLNICLKSVFSRVLQELVINNI